MKRYCNENDPRSLVFASNSDKRCGTAFNFAHPPKWRWVLLGIILVPLALALLVENRAVRIGWNIVLLLFCMTWPRLLRSMAERQLSLHPGPMGLRTPDGLYAAAEMFSVEGERRKFFYIIWIILAVLFTSVLAVGIHGGMLWLRAVLFAVFLSVMVMVIVMVAFGFLGLVGEHYRIARRKDAVLLPPGVLLLVMMLFAFPAITDFCSSRTMHVMLPNGEQTEFRVPIDDDRKPQIGEGWKAYRGYRDGKAHLLIYPGAGGEPFVIHVGTKGPIVFFSRPMDGDDITVFNMHSKRVFHVKRGVDGVWSMKGDNTVWVQ